MSEYRYYEFHAIDRSLTRKEMEELRGISSRAQISSRRFANEYNWGDLKADPERLLERYFDAGLYFANWGSRWCMFRFPSSALKKEDLLPYCNKETVFCKFHKDHLTLSLDAEIEEPEWFEADNVLDALIPLRDCIIQGDFRPLLIAWLGGMQHWEYDPDEADPEFWGYEDPVPPVPPGLGDLTPAMAELADFLSIDEDILAAAAEYSLPATDMGPSANEISRYVSALSQTEKDTILASIISDNNPTITAEFRQRALKFFRKIKENEALNSSLQLGTLLKRSQAIKEDRLRLAAERLEKEKAIPFPAAYRTWLPNTTESRA